MFLLKKLSVVTKTYLIHKIEHLIRGKKNLVTDLCNWYYSFNFQTDIGARGVRFWLSDGSLQEPEPELKVNFLNFLESELEPESKSIFSTVPVQFHVLSVPVQF